MKKIKIIRTATIGMSLNILLKGQLRFLNQKFNIFGLSTGGSDLNQVESREGIKTIAVRMERGISPVQDVISLVRLFLIFKREKPTIVHSITPKAGLLTMLAGKLAAVPIRVHTFTGLIFPSKRGFLQKILIQMDRLLCWAATNIYPEGNGVKEDLVNYKITKKPLRVLANGNVNGLDLKYYSKERMDGVKLDVLRRELGIEKSDLVFTFVGRLVGDKGINELVEAFDSLSSINAKLLLVGPMESDIDPLSVTTVDRIKNNERIISVGFQEDVRPYFSISSALVFPSYREGFPNVVLQAGAMDLPSIVTNINGSNEIILDGVNGLIVPVANIDRLAESMKRLVEDEDLYHSLKSKSRIMIEQRYEQHIVWDAILAEYEMLLAEKGVYSV